MFTCSEVLRFFYIGRLAPSTIVHWLRATVACNAKSLPILEFHQYSTILAQLENKSQAEVWGPGDKIFQSSGNEKLQICLLQNVLYVPY